MITKSLVDVKHVAEMLGCSQRGVWRLRDCGKLPPTVSIGRLVRWRLSDISQWIWADCPDVRRTGWKPNVPESEWNGVHAKKG